MAVSVNDWVFVKYPEAEVWKVKDPIPGVVQVAEDDAETVMVEL